MHDDNEDMYDREDRDGRRRRGRDGNDHAAAVASAGGLLGGEPALDGYAR